MHHTGQHVVRGAGREGEGGPLRNAPSGGPISIRAPVHAEPLTTSDTNPFNCHLPHSYYSAFDRMHSQVSKPNDWIMCIRKTILVSEVTWTPKTEATYPLLILDPVLNL